MGLRLRLRFRGHTSAPVSGRTVDSGLASPCSDKIGISEFGRNMDVLCVSVWHCALDSKSYDRCKFDSVKIWLVESPLNKRENLLDE